MSFLTSRTEKTRHGVLIDIGSGSVLVAIIASKAGATAPEIIWSKREYTPLRSVVTLTQSAKSVMTSLLNALMLLDSEGREVFREKTGKNRLPVTQITIAAPWSHTITKTIHYAHDEPFTLTDALVAELLQTAHKKIAEELKESERVADLDLVVICRSVIAIIANGYKLKIPNNQEVRSLQLIESSAVVQKNLIDAISDVRDKVFADSDVHLYSFILVYYTIVRDLFPDDNEYCLVDVTYEAIEVGIVRSGVLEYTTHIPHGSFSLAREFSTVIGVPVQEAFSYLANTDPTAALTEITETKKAELQDIINSYKTKLATVFKETGDSLAIPKKIFLHGDLQTEPFFSTIIAAAAYSCTNTSHAVYMVSHELLTEHYGEPVANSLKKGTQDTALLISAQFFHTPEYPNRFEQL